MSRKLRTVVCDRCGKAFLTSAARVRYCQDCSKQERLDRDRIRQRKVERRLRREPCDLVEVCLTCTRENCPGSCEKIGRKQ